MDWNAVHGWAEEANLWLGLFFNFWLIGAAIVVFFRRPATADALIISFSSAIRFGLIVLAIISAAVAYFMWVDRST